MVSIQILIICYYYYIDYKIDSFNILEFNNLNILEILSYFYKFRLFNYLISYCIIQILLIWIVLSILLYKEVKTIFIKKNVNSLISKEFLIYYNKKNFFDKIIILWKYKIFELLYKKIELKNNIFFFEVFNFKNLFNFILTLFNIIYILNNFILLSYLNISNFETVENYLDERFVIALDNRKIILLNNEWEINSHINIDNYIKTLPLKVEYIKEF